MSDKLTELLEQQDEYKAQIKLVEDLLESPSWKWLASTVATNIGIQRRTEFDSNLESLDDAFRTAHRKGLIAGLQLAITTPQTFKEGAETDLNLVTMQIKEQQDE